MTNSLTNLQKILMVLCGLNVLIIMHQHIAWLLMGLSYYLLWRNNANTPKSIMIWMMAIVTIHHLIGYATSHNIAIPLPIHDLDSGGFHLAAVAMNDYARPWQYSLPQHWHSHFIQFRYIMQYLYLISPSWYLGSETIIVFFTLGLLSLYRLLRCLDVNKTYIIITLALFGLLPQNLLWTSTTMREAIELVLMINMALLTVMHIKQALPWPKLMLLTVGNGICLIMFHPANIIIVICLSLATLIISIPLSIPAKRKLAAMIIGSAITIMLVPIFNSHALISTFKEALIAFRTQSLLFVGNTNYLENMQYYPNPSDWPTFIIHSSKLYANYLFGPFPWKLFQYSTSIYKLIILMLYAWFRAIMMVIICLGYRKESQSHQHCYQYLIFFYVLMTAIFSLGTFNFMQGLRHHALSDWILFVLCTRALTHINISEQFKLLFSPGKMLAKTS